ncbi:MAG: tRNA pseudouridine(13) synthase TruD [Methylococcaceae bacterium]|nr:tRNA pseudouridine(13) synthase TruD [Methylococcaceae bacterium]
MNSIAIPVWPHAYGKPSGQGILRREVADFVVFETLSFEPSGAGEHVFLQIQKTAENTDFIARQLARFAGVRQRDVSYAGLKDRHAIATQWFSVWLPGKSDPDWSTLASENLKVLQVIRHARKLKRGVLAANHFKLRIRDWQGDVAKTEQQLDCIKQHGVPNYFGVQRFGSAGQNVNKALAMFQGAKAPREQRSIYLSAARAYLFNQVLAERVRQNSWQQALAGDVFMLAGSKSHFQSSLTDEGIDERLLANDIHPTGPLWGLGEQVAKADAVLIEAAVMAQYPALVEGLLQEKLDMARRALRLLVQNLEWQFVATDTLELSFSLPPGCYATAVLREIIADL